MPLDHTETVSPYRKASIVIADSVGIAQKSILDFLVTNPGILTTFDEDFTMSVDGPVYVLNLSEDLNQFSVDIKLTATFNNGTWRTSVPTD